MAASALALNPSTAKGGNLPTGGNITAGQGNINQNVTSMTVQQNTSKMIVDWNSFSIGADHTVNFVQPNAQSIAFNRVTGSDPSVIQGHLNANGQVFLVNPNGVLFTKTSQVNVGGIITSTLALSDADFLAGNYKFEGNSSNAIINQGNIVSGTNAQGGDVVMIAAKITNDGTINAQGGTVALGSGSKVTLDLGGVVKLHVDAGIIDALIQNGGAIRSDGGTILLTAQAADALSHTVIKNTGMIEAQTLSTGPNGKIILKGGANDVIAVGGTLDASAPHKGDGGFIETSAGQVILSNDLKITTASSHGLFGNWLIDPEIIEIVAGSTGSTTGLPATGVSQIGTITLSDALALSNVDLNATGWIDFKTDFNYAGATNTLLSLYAPVVKLGGNISTSTAKLGLNFGGTYNSTFYNGDLFVYGGSRTIATRGGSINFAGNIGGEINRSLSIDTVTGSTSPGNITHSAIVDGNFFVTTVLIQVLNVQFTAGNKADVLFDCTTGELRVNGVVTPPATGFVPLGHLDVPGGTIMSLNASDSGTDTVTITLTDSSIITIKPTPNGRITIPAGGLSITKIEYYTKSANAQNIGTNNTIDIYNSTLANPLLNYTAQAGTFTLNPATAIDVSGDIRISVSNFLNSSDANALVAGSGYTWQVWSSNPDPFNVATGDVRGGLDYNFKQYGATYGLSTVLGAGNGLLYTYVPKISFSLVNDLTKVYDANNNATGLSGHYQASGAVDGDTIGESGSNPLPNVGTFASHNVGTGINISVSGISVNSILAYNTTLSKPVYGYGLQSAIASGNIGIITKANISAITGITAYNKVYDGFSTATLNTTGAVFVGGYSGDDLTVATSTGAFDNKNVGVGKTVSITGLTLGGSDATNYNLLSNTGSTTANITKLTLTDITGITAADRTYNATTSASLNYSSPTFVGKILSNESSLPDDLSITSAVGTFANKNANALPKTVTVSSIVLGGADAGNYNLPLNAPTTTATISKATISNITSITANNKVYDSTTNATLNTSSAVFNGKFAGDTLTVLTSTGTFDDKNVGTGKTVSVTNLSLGGTDAPNYNLASTIFSTTANITKANITAITGITANNKVYNGSSTATLNLGSAGFTGKFSGDILSVNSASGAFIEPHVGLAKTVNITGLTLGGLDAGNYNLVNTTATTVADITKATISEIIGITANNKTYNANTAATLNVGSVDFSGAVTGDNLTVATSTGTFDDKNVGVAKTVYVSNLTLGGSDAENYTLTKTTAVASANITKANISAITGITAYNKIYDSTTDATLNLGPAVFVGKFSGDTLNVATATGKFVDKNVGTNKTVNISGLTLGGTDAGNYNLVNNTATATANIVAAGISAITSISGITASDKTYDGNTSATLDVSGAIFPGIQGSDVLTVATSTGNFIDKNAGINKVVNITGLTLGGKDAGNYTLLNTTSSTTASISQKTITAISGITANNKVYDSLTTASLSVSGASFSGKITGDTLTVATYAGAFIDKNVGTGKTVNITGLSLGGTDAINYTLASSIASTTANITKANIARITGITANDKVYDSLTTATLNVGSAGFTGILGSDSLSVATSTGTFTNKNAGIGKTVNITGLTLGGIDKDNYTLVNTTATTTANISKASISEITSITANNKVYDSNSVATLNVSSAGFTGKQGSDNLTVATSTGTFVDGPHVGTGKTVQISGLTLGGTDAANYILTNSTAITTANITPANITAINGITANNKIYDGNDTATLNVGSATFVGMYTGDDLTVATSTGTFNNKNVGTGKAVNITGLTLGGSDAVNYNLVKSTATTTANISKLTLTDITSITALDREYNATTHATLDYSGAKLIGKISGDNLIVASATGNFASKDADSLPTTVNISAIVLGGTDAGNYSLPLVLPTTTATISKANIANITGITADDKLYDGNTTAKLNVGSAYFTNKFDGDNLTVATASGEFDNHHVGENKTVNISNLSLGGTDARNYNLIDTTATTTAAIYADEIALDTQQFLPKGMSVPVFPVYSPTITLFGQSHFFYKGLNFLVPEAKLIFNDNVSDAPAWTYFPIGLVNENPIVKQISKNGSDYIETDKRDGGTIIRSGEGPTNVIVVEDGVRLEMKSKGLNKFNKKSNNE